MGGHVIVIIIWADFEDFSSKRETKEEKRGIKLLFGCKHNAKKQTKQVKLEATCMDACMCLNVI